MSTPFRLAAALLAAGAALSTLPARAAIVEYDFEVTIDSGPLAARSFGGRFAFDDATGGPGFNAGETAFALTSFRFLFDGTDHDLQDLDYGDAVFTGTTLLGLDAAAPAFAFLPAGGGFAASFAYDFGSMRAGTGSFAIPAAQGVPEPSALWLAAVALPLLGAARGRPTSQKSGTLPGRRGRRGRCARPGSRPGAGR